MNIIQFNEIIELLHSISDNSTAKDGKTIYTTDVIVEEHEFAQNKDSGAGADSSETPKTDKDGFMEAKDGEIPFD